MLDLKLNKNTHDLDISSYDLQLIDGIDYLEQRIKQTLLFFYGEWFINITTGIKYFEFIFIKNPNLTLIDNLFKVAITEVTGVNEITKYESEFTSDQRLFNVNFSVTTDYGELNSSQGVSL